jgi:hypothetical protein
LGISAAAAAAGLWTVATGGSPGNALFFVALALAVFGLTLLQASEANKSADILASFPGPVTLSAPLWQRALLCTLGIAVACFLVYMAMEAAAGRRGEWDPLRAVVFAAFGLLVGVGALLALPRWTLRLDANGLEYRYFRGTYAYRWSAFSAFRVFGSRWHTLVCVFPGQQIRSWRVPRGLLIAAPLGISKYDLKALLERWQARALAGDRAPIARPDTTPPKGRSLLDYA